MSPCRRYAARSTLVDVCHRRRRPCPARAVAPAHWPARLPRRAARQDHRLPESDRRHGRGADAGQPCRRGRGPGALSRPGPDWPRPTAPEAAAASAARGRNRSPRLVRAAPAGARRRTRACSIRSGTPGRSRSAPSRGSPATAPASASSPRPSGRSRASRCAPRSSCRRAMRAPARSSKQMRADEARTADAAGRGRRPCPRWCAR